MCTEFLCERFFIFPTAQCHSFETHFARILYAKMPEPSDALHGDNISGPCSGIAQCVEDVTPAHIKGPASSADNSSGITASAGKRRREKWAPKRRPPKSKARIRNV